jgi:2-keto-4-pentenoate hydratase/2-oxohepta-3-ene-1,7-dioic acid hydratase in catechol pathway
VATTEGSKALTWYALASYEAASGMRAALVLGSCESPELFDLEDVYRLVRAGAPAAPWLQPDLLTMVESWHANQAEFADLAAAAQQIGKNGGLTEIDGGFKSVRAPIRPPRIFAAASNYVEHAKEMGTVLAGKADSNPYVFIKASTAVIGPGDNVVIPAQTKKPDWEVELAAVIGCRTRRISVEDALSCVVGYTIVNDVSARDLTRRSDYPFKFDWFQGKSFDTFAPLGPWIVPRDVVRDPQQLQLGLSVNDEVMQDGSTAEMIFSVAEQISYLSWILTLEPGDVIATGTPTGVGASRGIFLQAGDVMQASVEHIGELRNPVVAEIE